MVRHRRRLFALVLGLGLLVAALPSPAAEKASPRGKDFLWKVTSPGATAYLLGSVHVLNSTAYRSDTDFENAFQQAQIVVFETDLGQLDSEGVQQMLLSRGSYPKGESLRKSIPEKVYFRVEKAAGALGLPPGALNRFRPWFCAMTLANLKLAALGFNPEKGVDRYFYQKARSSGKKILGLETPSDQIDIFADMPPETQEKFLEQSLDDLESARSQVEKILAAWKTGDTGKIKSILLKGLREDPGLYQQLVVQRNLRWMKTLEHLLGGHQNFLVVVGAAHLVGSDGLVALLRTRGFKVEQQ
ncbi:MAG: TraB/GumN family protein [Desulfuromonadales bacterium]